MAPHQSPLDTTFPHICPKYALSQGNVKKKKHKKDKIPQKKSLCKSHNERGRETVGIVEPCF